MVSYERTQMYADELAPRLYIDYLAEIGVYIYYDVY